MAQLGHTDARWTGCSCETELPEASATRIATEAVHQSCECAAVWAVGSGTCIDIRRARVQSAQAPALLGIMPAALQLGHHQHIELEWGAVYSLPTVRSIHDPTAALGSDRSLPSINPQPPVNATAARGFETAFRIPRASRLLHTYQAAGQAILAPGPVALSSGLTEPQTSCRTLRQL